MAVGDLAFIILYIYDVTALFASVPVDERIRVINGLLVNDTSLSNRTKLSPQQVTDLLSVCLKTTYFKHNATFNSVCEGAAMGSPVSPIIANLFMENFESWALSSFTSTLKFYGRYVDDTMCISNLRRWTTLLNIWTRYTLSLNSRWSMNKTIR